MLFLWLVCIVHVFGNAGFVRGEFVVVVGVLGVVVSGSFVGIGDGSVVSVVDVLLLSIELLL